jgi:hypothetical protein
LCGAQRKIPPRTEGFFFLLPSEREKRKILIFLFRASAGSKLCLRNYLRFFAALRFVVLRFAVFFAALRFFAMVVCELWVRAGMSTRLREKIFHSQTFLYVIIARKKLFV